VYAATGDGYGVCVFCTQGRRRLPFFVVYAGPYWPPNVDPFLEIAHGRGCGVGQGGTKCRPRLSCLCGAAQSTHLKALAFWTHTPAQPDRDSAIPRTCHGTLPICDERLLHSGRTRAALKRRERIGIDGPKSHCPLMPASAKIDTSRGTVFCCRVLICVGECASFLPRHL
jgi:hypothetical protein